MKKKKKKWKEENLTNTLTERQDTNKKKKSKKGNTCGKKVEPGSGLRRMREKERERKRERIIAESVKKLNLNDDIPPNKLPTFQE